MLTKGLKKKSLTVLVLILASFMFFSCGKKEDEDAKSTTEKKEVAKTETAAKEVEKMKAGFVYVGAVGDYGWTHAHDQGRKFAMEKLPWLETIYVESIGEADSSRVIDRLIQEEKCDVVFTTSFGYMDDTIKAGQRYPDKFFMHASGFKQAKNVGTYFQDFYQLYYLNGLMAGAMSKTDKIGYVAAFPIPELFRHINAFALGVKAANPKAKVSVKWIYSWFGPEKAKEAAESLIAEGCDTLAFTEDTPAVIEVGQDHTEKGKQIYTFSHYSPMQNYGKDSVVSGQLSDWGPMYVKILSDIKDKTWTNEDMWWLVEDDAVHLGGDFKSIVNPKFEGELKAKMMETAEFGKISVYDLVSKRYAQMKNKEGFDPYQGPVMDNEGNLKIKEGEKATKAEMLGMMYFVDNIEGAIPK